MSRDGAIEQRESDFPYLSSKISGKRAAKGRRKGAEVEFGKAGVATLTKSIEDPSGVLGKKCKARLLSECLDTYTAGVTYSLNRKNRWAEINTSALLKSSNASAVESQVVERVFTAKNHGLNWTNYNVVAVHSLDNQDTLRTLTAGGKGTNLVSLTMPPREKQRGCRAKRENAAKKTAELLDRNGTEVLENLESPKIQYNICKAHPSSKVFSGKLYSKSIFVPHMQYFVHKLCDLKVNNLTVDSELTVHWLNDSCRRVSIDATSKITKMDTNPILVIVFEECRRKTFSYPSQLISSTDSSESRFITRRIPFQPSVNSQFFKRTAKVISEGQMAEILCKECKNIQSDPFELIEHEDFNFSEEDNFSEYSQPEITGFSPVTVKCQTCVNSYEDDLFELDDCWKCRNCLKQYIISQIRIRNIPIEIPFVLNQGQSLYNMLTAVIPLPLISFYTKAAATDLLKCSAVGDLTECPACKKAVLVERPNEYNSCVCSDCDTHWCSECNFEPHWPMSCCQFKIWTEKWDKQYPYAVFGDNVLANVRHVECYWCGELVCEIGGKKLKCICRIYPRPEVLPSNILAFPKTIKKDISELCSSAHSLRFSCDEKKRFELKVRKMKKIVPTVEKLIDMRTTILFVVENGLAWCYLEKTHPNVTVIKVSLIRLMKQLQDTEICMETPRNLNSSIFRFNGEKIEALEINLNKVIDLLKKNI
uniref:RBR-type E3 ubiquitin transferase n=1 Tax=Heterorhabditis bacteriophora TaxID=37862 RepID=A0A1I7XM87_HETBA